MPGVKEAALRGARPRRDPMVFLLGMVAGACIALSRWSYAPEVESASTLHLLAHMALWAQLGGAVLFLLRRATIRLVMGLRLPVGVQQRWHRWEWVAWSPILLLLLSGWGLNPGLPVLAGLLLLIAGIHTALLLGSVARTPHIRATSSVGWLGFLFFLSGWAALIYQVVWQRLLYVVFGVNMESVTVIVAIFMFGLGMGALLGGWLADRLPHRLPTVFMFLEFGVGAFGLISLPLILTVGETFAGAGAVTRVLAIFGLLCIPTMLMGATLPVLVTHLNSRWADVGRSLSGLYFVNTLGSAVSSFVTVGVLFALMGLRGTVWVAAALNIGVGGLVYRYARSLEKAP